MNIFSRLFRRAPKNTKYAPTFNGYTPLFTQYGTNVYAFDVVQQTLKCVVDEFKKTRPEHIRARGTDPVFESSSTVQAVLSEPNRLMTTSEFLEKTAWLLLLNYNAFVVPVYRVWIDEKTGAERRYYEALYPILPLTVEFIEDAADRLFVRFTFRDGTETTFPYDDIIHLRLNYSVNEYMGGNELGEPDQRGLLETLNLNRQLLEGIAKAMKASYSVSAIVKYNSLIDEEKMAADIAKFQERLDNSKSSVLPTDLKADFIPIDRNAKIVDEPTLKFIDEKILRNFGVPLPILRGDFTKEQYESFSQKTLEPLINLFSQAFTKKLFTSREKAYGNKVIFYQGDMIFMTASQKIRMIEVLAPTGAISENEKRIAVGLPPLPELSGVYKMSLNWIDTKNADAYQVGNVNVDVIDEEKEDV